MPESRKDKNDASWTQTLITITPEENATIRQIANKTVISGVGDTPVEIGVNEIANCIRTAHGNTIIKRDLFQLRSVSQIESKDEGVQTNIRCDPGLGKVLLDADTQTSLTCEPKRSHGGLLSEWIAAKEFSRDIISECLETGVYPRIIVNSIFDEVIERCACRIRFPTVNKIVQTLAVCNGLRDKDDEVLRKLRLEVFIDTLQSSIIVLPLIGILLERVCQEIRENASIVAIEILNYIQRKSVTIATRLAAIRQEAVSHNPMDEIFNARKKRLGELLRDKKEAGLEKSTQTELAGVPEIKRIVTKPKETICSRCSIDSECDACQVVSFDRLGRLDDRQKDMRNAKNQILRTQDILIAYNPCYVVPTQSKIPRIQSPAEAPRRFLQAQTISETKPNPEEQWSDVSSQSSNSAKLEEEIQATTSSLKDWRRVAQDASSISGAWTIQGSRGIKSNITLRQVERSPTCFPKKECTRSQCNLPVQSIKALRLLKKTFNRNYESSCSDCSYEQEDTNDSSAKIRMNDGVKIVPVIHLPNKIYKTG